MALTSKASDTQTAVLTTVHTLATISDPGVYQFNIDLSNLVPGENVELIMLMKTLAGGASTRAYGVTYINGQGDPQKFSIPVTSLVELVITLEQNGGTGRAFPWNVAQLDG